MTARRRGSPHAPMADRFWAKVDKNGPVPPHRPELGPCWVWTAGKDNKGYGQFGIGSRNDGTDGHTRSHRVSFFLEYGRWPMPHALHHCDNPSCVNPAHVYEGDNAQNAKDRVDRGRTSRGIDRPGAKLTEATVAEIRSATGSQRAIAKRFGVSQWTVCHVRLGKVWKHV
jgi:hypothetical protein